jgi:hypothetical protein
MFSRFSPCNKGFRGGNAKKRRAIPPVGSSSARSTIIHAWRENAAIGGTSAWLVGFVVAWLLIACAVAWAVGKAARIGGPAQDAPGPAQPSQRARRSYAGRKVRRNAAAGASAPHRASPSSYRVSSRVAGRSVH